MNGDKFVDGDDGETAKSKLGRARTLSSKLAFDEKKYEFSDEFVPANTDDPMDVHTTGEMLECLKNNDKVTVDARVIAVNESGYRMVKMNKAQLLEASKQRDSKKLRESGRKLLENDWNEGGDGETIGRDFNSLLGGPFDKQLYYRDYLRMISASFYAYHHDPVARDIVNIICDFTVGRGFQLHTDNKAAQMLWNAFSEANDFHTQFEHCAQELSIYGEVMWWELPNNEARISFNPMAGEKVPKAILPRIRLIDPSNIAEIITVPEDPIKGVLYYVWLAPTQYQMWTRDNQPSNKFIYTQIPAEQMMHFKVNSVSNEKRGRSDYFPALGYMKRLRDSVNYSIVAQQKAAAWCIDTTIQGNQQDINNYIQDQQDQGQIPTAGSEFVHTEAIKREYLSNNAGRSGESPAFNWCLNMICMSSGIPVSYLGTHLSGGQTRASALVSTEPVAKRFERRRLVYERMIRTIFNRVMRRFNITAECEIIFPELITQDRSAKLRDLMTAQNASWISHRRASEFAAKELDVKNFDYDTEQIEVLKDDKALGITPAQMNPLTTPGQTSQANDKPSGLPSSDKKKVKDNLRSL